MNKISKLNSELSFLRFITGIAFPDIKSIAALKLAPQVRSGNSRLSNAPCLNVSYYNDMQ